MRGGAHRPAQPGAHDQRLHAEHQDSAAHPDDDLEDRHRRPGHLTSERSDDRREAAIRRPVEEHHHVLQHEGHPNRRDQRREPRGRSQRPVRDAIPQRSTTPTSSHPTSGWAIPKTSRMVSAAYAPTMNTSPWAKLMSWMTP